MVTLSVNVNKVATLRNARGGEVPDLIEAVQCCIDAGVRSITVHPRLDQRHIRPDDVRAIATHLKQKAPGVEFNIEGDPRPDWLELVHEIRPTQATFVPVLPGEITSQAGWPPDQDTDAIGQQIAELKAKGVRCSLFINPNLEAVQWAKDRGADRVELFTEPYARAFAQNPRDDDETLLADYKSAGQAATQLGLGINAGHDLDAQNLGLFCSLARQGCNLLEVSIGHALISQALFDGLGPVVREYLRICEESAAPA